MLTEKNIQDFMNLTYENRDLDGIIDYAQAEQNYALYEFMTAHTKTFDGGTSFKFRILYDTNDTVVPAGLYEKESYNQKPKTALGEIDIRKWKNSGILDYRELALQGKEEAVSRIVEEKETMQLDWVRTMDSYMWDGPDDVNDKTTMHGIKHWVQTNAVAGFNGGNPDGFPGGRGGVSSVTYPNAKNYTDHATVIDDEDLIPRIEMATRKINFQSVMNFKEPTFSTSKRIFVSDGVSEPLKKVLKDSNMNVGTALSLSGPNLVFGSVPVIWAPGLDNRRKAENDPMEYLYFLDAAVLRLAAIKGFLHKVRPPKEISDMPYCYGFREDAMTNMICTNLKKLAVITIAA